MYSIGQILFIISSGTRTIEPIQVHSKQTLETMDGATVQHMCATVDNKTISLEKHQEKGLLSGVFSDLDNAEKHLLGLASQMVAKLADKAREKSSVFQKKPSDEQVEQVEPESLPGTDESRLFESVQTITLENGTKANIHMPSEMS